MSRKGENIFKRQDGRWEARYIRGRDEGGKALYGYCYGKTYREAKEKVAGIRSGQPPQNGGAFPQGQLKFSQLCEDWLVLRQSEVKQSTCVKYEQIVREHILPGLGNRPLQKLTTETVEEFKRSLLEKKKLSPNTVKTILIVLRAILGYGAKRFPGNLDRVEIRYPKVSGSTPRVLSEEEQTRLVRFLLGEAELCRYGILLALLTGMRLGELCALKWENVSLAERTIRVDASLQRLRDLDEDATGKTRLLTGTPKSESSQRVIPLSAEALALCAAMRLQDGSAYVLTGTQEPMEPRTLQYRLKRFTVACGLEGVHFHTLRHTFATRCVEAGFEIKSLSEVMGHSSTKITLDRYVHTSMDLKRANMEKVAMLAS